MTKWKRT